MITTCIVSSSVAWRILFSTTATVTVSCHSYGWVGMLRPAVRSLPDRGFASANLLLIWLNYAGCSVSRPVPTSVSRTSYPWMRPFRDGLASVRRAFDAAQETADLTFAGYSCGGSITHLLASGHSLGQVQREAENALEFVQKTRFGVIVATINLQLGLIRTLRGFTPAFGFLSDGAFDEGQFEQYLEDDPRLAHAGRRYWVRKLQARYYAGDYGAAVAAATKAQRLLSKSPSLLAYSEAAEYHLHGALAPAAACGSAPSDERRPHFDALLAHHRQIALSAENCPEKLAYRATLVSAEIARLQGRELDAMRLYEEAVPLARVHGFIQNEGIVNELAARFYAARDLTTIADAYLRNARSCYVRWGADGKVRHLDQAHPGSAQQPPSSHSDRTIGTSVEQLELATVVEGVAGGVWRNRSEEADRHADGDRARARRRRPRSADCPARRRAQDRSGSHKRPRHGRGPSSQTGRPDGSPGIGSPLRDADSGQPAAGCHGSRARSPGTNISARSAAGRFCACR